MQRSFQHRLSRSARAATAFRARMLLCGLAIVLPLSLVGNGLAQDDDRAFPLRAQRVLFLGDSITHAGHYVALIEAQLRLQQVDPMPDIINLGLSSETCSGLSEEGHPFPRPDVHERLDRALEQLKPDVVVACYGMNDGIYHPQSDERFAAYQDGVNRLIEKVHASGAKLVLLTPPPFDPVPLVDKGKLKPAGEEGYAYFAMYEGYNDVLTQYARWIMEQRERVEMVIDVHTPTMEHLATQRRSAPNYTVAPDGIHPNAIGHQIIARAILDAWGVVGEAEVPEPIMQAITRRNQVLHDAYLTSVGHQRPGVAAGTSVDEARRIEAELLEQIEQPLQDARKPSSDQTRVQDGVIYRVSYAPSQQPGQLVLGATYRLYIPDGVKQLRGIIVHQHGCGAGASIGGRTAADDLHWQALARKWNCALLGPAIEPRDGVNCRLWCDPRNGSGDRFLEGLDELASQSEHPEVATVPWCLWGHSGGAFWSSLVHAQYPERVVAVWLRSGGAYTAWSRGEIPEPELSDAVFQVPVMANPGVKERDDARFRVAWDGAKNMQAAYLEQGAPFYFAGDPRTGHECGDSRYLAIPFFDLCLAQRLPVELGQPLRPFDPEATVWTETFTAQWHEYEETGAVSDTSPPPAPTQGLIRMDEAGKMHLAWHAAADLESGIAGFVIRRNGEVVGRLPENPVGRFGRPLLQGMSYHDTPEPGFPAMEYVDEPGNFNELPTYTITTVNSVGLESEPATAGYARR
ncbi:MAG: SGNH/GDSL hydrolase family protein [Pirellulaceae bacterium]